MVKGQRNLQTTFPRLCFSLILQTETEGSHLDSRAILKVQPLQEVPRSKRKNFVCTAWKALIFEVSLILISRIVRGVLIVTIIMLQAVPRNSIELSNKLLLV